MKYYTVYAVTDDGEKTLLYGGTDEDIARMRLKAASHYHKRNQLYEAELGEPKLVDTFIQRDEQFYKCDECGHTMIRGKDTPVSIIIDAEVYCILCNECAENFKVQKVSGIEENFWLKS